jgi:hypothetical protein
VCVCRSRIMLSEIGTGSVGLTGMTAHATEQCIHCYYCYYYSKTARLATSDAMRSKVSLKVGEIVWQLWFGRAKQVFEHNAWGN